MYETGVKSINGMFTPDNKETGVFKYIGEVDRSFMKNPLMVFFYGAGIASIKRAIGTKYADSMLADISNSDEDVRLEAIKLAKEVISDSIKQLEIKKEKGANVAWLIDKRKKALKLMDTLESTKYKEISMTSKNSITKEIYDSVNDETQRVYGDNVANYLNKTFEDIVKFQTTINNVFIGMFGVFKSEFDERLKVQKDNKTKPSKQDIDIVLNEMMKDGKVPGVLTVDAKNDSEKAPVMKTARVDAQEGSRVQIKLKNASRVINPLVYDLVANPVAGAVTNVHYMDGAIIARLYKESMGLGVHDAWVSHVNDVETNGKLYNKTVWELTQKHDLVGLVQEAFENSYEENSEAFENAIRENYEDRMSKQDLETLVSNIYETTDNDLRTFSNQIKKNKKYMKTLNFSMSQMAGPEGVVYNSKGGEVGRVTREVENLLQVENSGNIELSPVAKETIEKLVDKKPKAITQEEIGIIARMIKCKG